MDALAIRLTDRAGVHVLQKSDIPQSENTIAKVELFANAWLAQNVTGYQARVHVVSLVPFNVFLGTWDLGAVIPANWWIDT